MAQGKTKFFALYLKLFCTFEVISRVKIFFLKKRGIRNTEYEQLSQEVKLQSRANKWGSCWSRKWGVQEKKFKFYLRCTNNTILEYDGNDDIKNQNWLFRMSSKLLEHVADKGDEISCAMKEFTFDKLPRLTAAETQLPSYFTQLDWGWESVRKGRGL